MVSQVPAGALVWIAVYNLKPVDVIGVTLDSDMPYVRVLTGYMDPAEFYPVRGLSPDLDGSDALILDGDCDTWKVLADDEVPDAVWAALAEWRSGHATP